MTYFARLRTEGKWQLTYEQLRGKAETPLSMLAARLTYMIGGFAAHCHPTLQVTS
jgi:hypothetical protein